MENWLYPSLSVLAKAIITVIVIFSVIILITRISGLKTFAKMSSFDFASTIAIGSILASVVLNANQSIVKAALALATVVGFQSLFSYCKRKFSWFNNMFTNKPILLMEDGVFLLNNLNKTNVSVNEVYAKLREANVKDKAEVLAVILESTGDISVIHTTKDVEMSEALLTGVTK